MTSIKAYVYDKNSPSTGRELGPAIKRLEVSIDGPVGSCSFYLDNSSGISQILETGDYIADLGIDNHTLLRGYIDDVLPELENAPYVFSKYVTVKGRNFGRDLTRLMIKADFKDTKLGDVFNVGLLAARSEIAADYASTGVGPVVGNIEANDMPLIDLFDDAVQKAKYGYTVNWDDKRLYAWSLENIPHTGVLLKLLMNDPENNILLINPHGKNGSSICNSVKIKCNYIDDQLTEDYPYKTGENATVQDDHEFFAVGKSSIKVTSTVNNYPSVHFKVPLFPPSDNRQYLDYTHRERNVHILHRTQLLAWNR
jgi:hypothetical protein